MKLFTVLLLGFLSVGSAALAQDEALMTGEAPDCIPKERVAKIAKHFKQFEALAKKGAVCASGAPVEHRLLHMITIIEDLKIEGPLAPSGDDLVQPILSQDWIEYFRKHVNELIDAREEKSCQIGNSVAYVITGGSKKNQGKMFFCGRFLKSDPSSLFDQMVVFLHETRHLENGVGHVTCSHGPRKDQEGSCDESPAIKGAYSVTVEAHARMSAFGTNLHPSAREASRASALAYAFEAFNEQPRIERAARPLLLSRSGELQLLGDDRLVTRRKDVPVGFMSKRQTFGYDVFPTDTSKEAVSYSPALSFIQPQDPKNGFVSSFNEWPAKFRPEIRGAHFGHAMDIWLESRRAVVYCRDHKEGKTERKEFASEKEKFANLIYPEGYESESALSGVLAESGRWAEIKCSEEGLPVLAWQKDPWKGPQRAMKIGDRLLGIDKEGRLVEKRGAKWLAVESAKNAKFSDLAPFDWVRYLDER